MTPTDDERVSSDAPTLASTTGGEGARGPARPLQKGESVGRYLIVRLLGAGGMGVVYAAFDPELDRKLAIKLLHRGDGSSAGGERARLLREAQAMAKLNHPNVVSVHDVGEHDGQVFVAMEFVEGKTLREWLAASRRTRREILDAFVRAGRGLAAAHDKGLVHRDFKPDNVMIGDDGRVRVLDFGLARPAGNEPRDPEELAMTERGRLAELFSAEQAITREGALVGTPAYMAPEQIVGAQTDARSDQFSFCVALYEALYGERPFAGDHLAALALSVTGGEVRPPPVGAAVPAWLRRVVVRGLAADPDARWPSMSALASALRKDPRRRRGQLLAGGVLLAGAAAVPVAAELGERRAIAACEAAGAEIGSQWNDEARAAVHQALVASGSRHAELAYEKAVPWFAAWTEQWSQLRTRVCVETQVAGTRTPEMGRRAIECLERNRALLARRLEDLRAGGERVVERAVKAGAELPRLEPCVDERWLANRIEAPDASTRGQVARVEMDLQIARDLDGAGEHAQALASAESALARARELGWEPLVAAAHVAIGELLERAGDYDRSESELTEGFLGAQRSGDDELAVYAGAQLVYTVGLHLARRDDALRWGELARASLERIGQQGTLNESALLNALAATHDVAGEFDQARALYEQAIAIDESIFGAEHPAIATGLNNLAIVHHGQGRYDEAQALYERALAMREELLGPFHTDVADSAGNLAVLHEYRGEYEQARALYERAHQIQLDAHGPEHPSVAAALLNLGLLHDTIGEPERAKPLIEQALRIDEKRLGPEHPDVAADLSSLAIVLDALGDNAAAIELSTRALAIHEKVGGPDHPRVGAELNNLGLMYHVAGEHERALGLLERALAVKQRALGPEHPDLAQTYKNLCKVEAARGRHREGAKACERSLALDLAAWGEDHALVAESRYELARVLRAGGIDRVRARELGERALAIYSSLGAAKQKERAEVEAWLRAAHEG